MFAIILHGSSPPLYWTGSSYAHQGVRFTSWVGANNKVLALAEQGDNVRLCECNEDWPIFRGPIERRAKGRTLRPITSRKFQQLVEAHWRNVDRGFAIDARLAGMTDPVEARELLIEHIRLARPKCHLRPQLWEAYAELHAVARRGMTPAYLRYELHDDDGPESLEKDLREGHAPGERVLPDVMPDPDDYKAPFTNEYGLFDWGGLVRGAGVAAKGLLADTFPSLRKKLFPDSTEN